jgi:hypothetical protein
MSKKTKLILLVAILVLLVVTAGALMTRDSITEAIYQKIHVGMALDEVEDVIGRRGTKIADAVGTLAKQGVVFIPPSNVLHDGNDWSKQRPDISRIICWQGSEAGITVQVDENGRVIGKRFEQGGIQRRSFFERLSIWLGW